MTIFICIMQMIIFTALASKKSKQKYEYEYLNEKVLFVVLTVLGNYQSNNNSQLYFFLYFDIYYIGMLTSKRISIYKIRKLKLKSKLVIATNDGDNTISRKITLQLVPVRCQSNNGYQQIILIYVQYSFLFMYS